MKYTPEEIDRVFNERVQISFSDAKLKRGLIAEWLFIYPTGKFTADVECAYPMDESEHDPVIAKELIMKRIKDKVWEICGKYTLATGDKL